MQVAPANYCWIIEVAEARDVYYVAEDGSAAGFGEDLFVEWRVGCGGYYQEHTLEVLRVEFALVQV